MNSCKRHNMLQLYKNMMLFLVRCLESVALVSFFVFFAGVAPLGSVYLFLCVGVGVLTIWWSLGLSWSPQAPWRH